MKQFRNPRLSIWQSAVDEVLARDALAAQPQGVGTGRPAADHSTVLETNAFCSAMDSAASPLRRVSGCKVVPLLRKLWSGCPLKLKRILRKILPEKPAAQCSAYALKLAKAAILGDRKQYEIYKDDFMRFGICDLRYLEAVEKYVEYFQAQAKKIPYRVYRNLSDFIIDGKLAAKARVAIMGDWGTGEEVALRVLRQIEAKEPNVVIHLGDIYYSGTEFEDEQYFYRPWRQILSPGIPTFSLSGNHDMYSGGVGYYKLIDQLGQPASYFCLRNDHWQFLAMDTGLHDHDPSRSTSSATYLEETEVAWHQDKIDHAGDRRTILLSHHQLFTAYEDIDGEEINLRLHPQVAGWLPKVALWLWGHEHNFVIYGPFAGLARGRCLGHAAFPVAVNEIPASPLFSNVPVTRSDASRKSIVLGSISGLYNHGYAIIDLDGPAATVSYFQDTDEHLPLFVETIS